MGFKKSAGPLFTIGIAVLPVLLWFVFKPASIGVKGISLQLDAFAKITALSALAVLSFNIILSARLPIFERLFLGLDRAYRAHRLIGGTVLILLLFHVMALTVKYSRISLISGYDFLKPTPDLALTVGKLTLAVMAVLIVISLYFKVRYQWFITIQRILGAMIFFGGYHALFVAGSDVRQILPLFVYMTLLGVTAASLYIYRSIFHNSIKLTYPYTVETVESSGKITQLWLKPVGSPIPFYAGQFSFVRFGSLAVDDESHPFSFSSGSDKNKVRLSIKDFGDYTSSVKDIKPGDGAYLEGPYGNFSFTKLQSRKQTWVAGGIGITPFLSMALSLPSGYDITLYYCVRKPEEAVYLNELKAIENSNKGFHVVTVVSDKQGQLTAETVRSTNAKDYLLCGPPAMMHDLQKKLVRLGVLKNNIHFEVFSLQ